MKRRLVAVTLSLIMTMATVSKQVLLHLLHLIQLRLLPHRQMQKK